MGMGLKEVNVNLEELIISAGELTLYDFICLAEKFRGDEVHMPKEYYSLEKSGYIKLTSLNDFILLEKGEKLFGKKADSLLELAREIRNMFPSGVKSGGYLVRSSEVDIAEKLRKFFKKHNYTHEQVIEATSKYIERKRAERWGFMQRAIYFIEKDGSSNLAAECDNLTAETSVNTFEREA